MADKNEESKPDDNLEKKIPVFTVVKNGSILKNIFLLDNPPAIPSLNSTDSVPTVGGDAHRKIQEAEEILVVGRHPDCNITLEHPSISRYHLRIHSKPSSQTLSVLDLSSVHGSWVSGKRIEPGILVELQEGDTVRLGGSSRVYELHWVPVNRAYDLEHQFMPPLDKSNDSEEETHQDENGSYAEPNERQLPDADLEGSEFVFMPPLDKSNDSEEDKHQDENSSYAESKEGQLPDTDLEGLKFNFMPPLDKSNDSEEETHQDQNSSYAETNERQLAHAAVEGLELLPCSDDHELSLTKLSLFAPLVSEGLNSTNCDEGEIKNEIQTKKDEEDDQTSSCEQLEIDLILPETENQLPLLGEESENALPHFCSGVASRMENAETPIKTNELLKSPNIWSRRGEVASIQIQTGRSRVQILPFDIGADIEPRNHDIENEIVSKSLIIGPDGDEEEIFSPDKENCMQNTYLMQSLNKIGSPEEIKQPKSYRLSPLRNTVSPCDNDENEIVSTFGQENLENVKHESVSKTLFSSAERNEDEDVFTPDKENFSPNTLLWRNIIKMDKAEKFKHSDSGILSSSKNIFCSDICQEKNPFLSPDGGTQTPKVLQERKSGKPVSKSKENLESKMTIKRLPFQSLPVISSSKTKSNSSVLGASSRSYTPVNYAQDVDHQNTGGVVKKMWTMVVDTKCLLHRGSRKALQLLQGVKGTQLIIPRIVIRELDQMKLRGSLFRRTTEASLALQWIEDCLVNAKSWIHVQSSVEEGMPIAPTPRALPLARLMDEWGGSFFSSAQIATPTTEDNVLECALFFRRIMIDRQFVLLSEDISLKINSIGEGVMCETAEEFRESLINPFSERFLWAESSPRGATWSCKDDIVLRERYYNFPLKKPQSLKGLKLILLHNSQFKANQFIS